MSSLDQELNLRLNALQEQGLRRELRRVDSPQSTRIQINGRDLLNFSSNDYLGLANHPALKEAAIKAVEKFGVGSGASRLICGSLAPHHELEETLATFKGTNAALTFSSGYAAAIGTICALVDKDDVIIIDKLVHASIVDAARLSGAKIRVFKHNDLANLEEILQATAKTKSRCLIVTESVFSMDGDLAPLKELAALKEKYGAWLMVDEAHATGLFGKSRSGLGEGLNLDIQMGTLGKALGSSGGYISGSRTLIDYLVNRARSFIFSTAPIPAAAAAATAAIRFVQSVEGKTRCELLWKNIAAFEGAKSAIIPIMIGDETKAVETATELRKQGIFIPAIRYPTVARGQARLRLTLTASHTEKDIKTLNTALNSTLVAADVSRP